MFSSETVDRWNVLREGRGHELLTLLARTLDDLQRLDVQAAGLPDKRTSTSQFNGYVDECAAIYVEKLRELFAAVADCVEKEHYLVMVNCLRSVVEHAGVLHEFLLKPSPRTYSETYNAGAADEWAYDQAIADFDKFIRGNAFRWDEIDSVSVEELEARAMDGSQRPVEVGKVALPALYSEHPEAKALYNMLSDMVHPNAGGHMLMLRTRAGRAVIGGEGDRRGALDMASRPLALTLHLYEKVIAPDLRRLIGLRLALPGQ